MNYTHNRIPTPTKKTKIRKLPEKEQEIHGATILSLVDSEPLN